MPYQPKFQNPGTAVLQFADQIGKIRETAAAATEDKALQKELADNEAGLLVRKRLSGYLTGQINLQHDSLMLDTSSSSEEKAIRSGLFLSTIPGAGRNPALSQPNAQETSLAMGLYREKPELASKVQSVRENDFRPNAVLTEEYQTWRGNQGLPKEKYAISYESFRRSALADTNAPINRWARERLEVTLNSSSGALDNFANYIKAQQNDNVALASFGGRTHILTGEDKKVWDYAGQRAVTTGASQALLYQMAKRRNLENQAAFSASGQADLPIEFSALLNTMGQGTGMSQPGAQPSAQAGGPFDARDNLNRNMVFGAVNNRESGFTQDDAQTLYGALGGMDFPVLSWLEDNGVTRDNLQTAQMLQREASRFEDPRSRNFFVATFQDLSKTGRVSMEDAVTHARTIADPKLPFETARDYQNVLKKGITNPRAAMTATNLRSFGVSFDDPTTAAGFNQYFGVQNAQRSAAAQQLVQLASMAGGTQGLTEGLKALPWGPMQNAPDNEITDLAVGETLARLTYAAQTGGALTTEESAAVRKEITRLYDETIIPNEKRSRILTGRNQLKSFFDGLGPLTMEVEPISEDVTTTNIREKTESGLYSSDSAATEFSTPGGAGGERKGSQTEVDRQIRQGLRSGGTQTVTDQRKVNTAISTFFSTDRDDLANMRFELQDIMTEPDGKIRQKRLNRWTNSVKPLIPQTDAAYEVLDGIVRTAAAVSGSNAGIKAGNNVIKWAEEYAIAPETPDSPAFPVGTGGDNAIFFRDKETGVYMTYVQGTQKDSAREVVGSDGNAINQPEEFMRFMSDRLATLRDIPEADVLGVDIEEDVIQVPEGLSYVRPLSTAKTEKEQISLMREQANPEERRVIDSLLMYSGTQRAEVLEALQDRQKLVEAGITDPNDYSSVLTDDRIRRLEDDVSTLQGKQKSAIINDKAGREVSLAFSPSTRSIAVTIFPSKTVIAGYGEISYSIGPPPTYPTGQEGILGVTSTLKEIQSAIYDYKKRAGTLPAGSVQPAQSGASRRVARRRAAQAETEGEQ